MWLKISVTILSALATSVFADALTEHQLPFSGQFPNNLEPIDDKTVDEKFANDFGTLDNAIVQPVPKKSSRSDPTNTVGPVPVGPSGSGQNSKSETPDSNFISQHSDENMIFFGNENMIDSNFSSGAHNSSADTDSLTALEEILRTNKTLDGKDIVTKLFTETTTDVILETTTQSEDKSESLETHSNFISEHSDENMIFFGNENMIDSNFSSGAHNSITDTDSFTALEEILRTNKTLDGKGLPGNPYNSSIIDEVTDPESSKLILRTDNTTATTDMPTGTEYASTTGISKTGITENEKTYDVGSRIGYDPNENVKKTKNDFKFIDINWDEDDGENDTDLIMKPRDFDSENGSEAALPPTANDNEVILRYPIEEIDPPLDANKPIVDSRANVNKTDPVQSTTIEDTVETTTTDDMPDSASNESTEVIDGKESEEEPLECKYGTDEFPIPEPKIDRSGRRIADIKCEEQTWTVKYNIDDALKNKRICKIKKGISTLIGAKRSIQGDFPHMGAIGWLTPENTPLFFCGSSLISTRFSVTAAHCKALPERGDLGVTDIYPKLVRFGNVDISDDKKVIDMKIEKIITLPEFDAAPLMKYNDIALIRFTEEIKFTDYIKPACLWHTSMRHLKTGNVTGWGKTVSDRDDSVSKHLRFAEVDFIDRSECADHLAGRPNRHWKGLSDEQFCAGKLIGGVDTCQGDSGGPIQVRRPFPSNNSISIHYVVGITSFGFDCGKPKLPGIYTSVRNYLCWIEKTVWPMETNTICN